MWTPNDQYIFTTAGSSGLQWSMPSTPQTETRLVSPSHLSSARGQSLPLLRNSQSTLRKESGFSLFHVVPRVTG